jgi:hypothetical protein
VRPRTGLDEVEKRKILPLPGLSTAAPVTVQAVASRYADYAIPIKVFSGKHVFVIRFMRSMYEYLFGQTIFQFQKFLS